VNASALDPALWITWYDLAPHDREAYLCWLHEQYMPKLVERPGVLWTAHYASEPRPPLTTKSHGRSRRHAAPEAVPQGHEFILLVGGEGPHVFSDPTPAQFEASLGPGERQMLALRNALASNVMLEHLRIEGPEARAGQAGEALSPCIQLGSFVFDGDEDELIVRPAVERAAANGVLVSGPFPADTLFVRAARGEFDVVIAAYHDQGLVPVKLLSFGRAVNVTLGLPIIRTSVDHGTAFDIAGKGIADESSLVEAILLAARLSDAAQDRHRPSS